MVTNLTKEEYKRFINLLLIEIDKNEDLVSSSGLKGYQQTIEEDKEILLKLQKQKFYEDV